MLEKHHVVSFGGRRCGCRRRRGTARALLNDNNVGEAHLHRAAGLRGAIVVVVDDDENTFVAAIGAMTVLGFGATVTSSSRDGDAGKLGEFGVSLVSIGVEDIALRAASSRLGDGPDGAPIVRKTCT